MKLRSIDFVSVQLIAKCAEKKSLVAAAHECHITVSAASRRLSIFEDLLDCKIFRRTFRGLEITEEGKIIINSCYEILLNFDKLIKKRSKHASEKPFELNLYHPSMTQV